MEVEIYIENGIAPIDNGIRVGTPYISGTFVNPITTGSNLNYTGDFKILFPITRTDSELLEFRRNVSGTIDVKFQFKEKEFDGITTFWSNNNYTGTSWNVNGIIQNIDLNDDISGEPLFGAANNIKSLSVQTGSRVIIANGVDISGSLGYDYITTYNTPGPKNTTPWSGNRPLITGVDGVDYVSINTLFPNTAITGTYGNSYGASPSLNKSGSFLVSGSNEIIISYPINGDIFIPSGSSSGNFVLNLIGTNDTGSLSYNINLPSSNITSLEPILDAETLISNFSFPDEFGLVYERLDMFDDENINVKFKLKDTSDLSKVYSTYSQTFTIPPSNKNNRLLNYYFNTDVVRDSKRYIKAKIYVNKELFKTGFIAINEGKFKYGNNSSYSINFFTSLTNLKELFGDETLATTLQSSSYDIQWNDQIAYDYTRGLAVTSSVDPNVIVPLVSNKRVWSYEVGAGGANNIRYTGTKSGVKYIEPNELKPAIPFSRIMDDIATSKGLIFSSSLFTQDEYTKMYAWCNRNGYSNNEYIPYILNTNWSNFDADWTLTNTVGDNVTTIQYNGLSNPEVKLRVTTLYEGFFQDIPEDEEIKYRWVNDDTGEVLNEGVFFFNVFFTSYFPFKPSDYGITAINPLNVRFEILTDIPVKEAGYNITLVSPTNTDLSRIISEFFINDVELYKLLPSIKTIDFISSFIKMFNISIIEDPNNNNVINFIPRNTFYSQSLDYTPYIDIESYNIKPNNLFKNINFKHKTSKYKSNEDFKIGVGNREYGELKYISSDKFLKDEYKIETQFSIVPNRLIPETQVQTFYGFTSNSEVTGTYGTLYTPNGDDFTIFYYNGSQSLKDISSTDISFNFNSGSSVLELETYNKVSIVYNDNTSSYVNSLGFKDEVDVFNTSFVFNKNLFSNYYSTEINRIYNPNSRLFEYECYLPSYEINRFSLENLLVIGNKKFSIEEADINIVTGKSKLTLMNLTLNIPTVL